MKKNLVMIIILLGVFGLTGCGNNEVEYENNISKEKSSIEENDFEEESSVEEEMGSINEISNEYTGIENMKVVFEKEYTEDATYYLVVTAYNINTNELVWRHKTKEYYVADRDLINYVFDGEDSTKLYLLEENSIKLLNMNTGKIVWESNNLVTTLTSGISLNGNLYLLDSYEATIYVVNQSNGKIVNQLSTKTEGNNYQVFTSVEDVIIIEYFTDDANYLEFDTQTNSFIN